MAVTAKRVTMKDIAAKVGVTQQSVSEVLTKNPKSRISNDTRKRIMTAARELKYRPNYLASSLKKGKTDTIGFLGEEIARDSRAITINNLVAAGIERSLPDEKSFIILSSNGERGLDKSLALARRGIVDGLIIQTFPAHYPKLEKVIIPELQEIGMPFVVIHPTKRMLPCSHVGVDRERAGYLAACDLLERGITDISMYDVWSGRAGAEETLAGITKAFAERGLPFGEDRILQPADVKPGELGFHFLPRNLERLLERLPRALIFTQVSAAVQAAKLFRSHGVRVPEDLVVSGFGMSGTHEFPEDGVELYGVSLEEQGRMATELLLKSIDDENGGSRTEYRIMMPVRMS